MHRPAHYRLNVFPGKNSSAVTKEILTRVKQKKRDASGLKRNGNYFFDTLHNTSPIESRIRESTRKMVQHVHQTIQITISLKEKFYVLVKR